MNPTTEKQRKQARKALDHLYNKVDAAQSNFADGLVTPGNISIRQIPDRDQPDGFRTIANARVVIHLAACDTEGEPSGMPIAIGPEYAENGEYKPAKSTRK